jgi:hypothetical protein
MSPTELLDEMSAKDEPAANDDHHRPQTLLAEVAHFLRYEKKWWLLPIVLVVLAMAVVAILAHPGVGPFIYQRF